jgi:hypothetical protein
MKTEKIYLFNKTLFYYIISENGKQHGLWNNGNEFIGCKYKNQIKGLWIRNTIY